MPTDSYNVFKEDRIPVDEHTDSHMPNVCTTDEIKFNLKIHDSSQKEIIM